MNQRKLYQEEGSATCSISNTCGVTIKVDDRGENVEYQFNDGEIETAPIEYTFTEDEDESQPYFLTKEHYMYYINQFVRNNIGRV